MKFERLKSFVIPLIGLTVLFWPVYIWYLPIQIGNVPLAKEKFQLSDFSPDGKRLYLDYCDASQNCQIGWFDLDSQRINLLTPQSTQNVIASPSSSDDGQKLVVVIKESASNFKTSQLGIIDLASNSYRQITYSASLKEWPTFSHDGKKIIYAQAGRIRSGGKTQFSQWDIYEMDLASGAERRLTNFCFFLISRPAYTSDNKHFVFSGEAPACNYPTSNPSQDHLSGTYEDYLYTQEGRELYRQRYRDNTVFLMAGSESTLVPLFMNGQYSGGASLSRDGKNILFTSITNEMDKLQSHRFNYDLFFYEDGVIRRLTHSAPFILDFVVSANGKYVLYISEPKARDDNPDVWLLDTTSGHHQRINFGQSATFSKIKLTQIEQ